VPGMNTSLKVPSVHSEFTLFGNVKVNRRVSAMKMYLEVMVRMLGDGLYSARAR
jgi:hypothetical protein